MKKTFVIAAFVAAGGAMGVTGTFAANAQQSKDGDERVVCKRDSTVGSRLGARTCLTRAQWRQIETEQRQRTRDIVDQSDRDNRSDPWTGPVPE